MNLFTYLIRVIFTVRMKLTTTVYILKVCNRMQPYAAVCSRMQPYAAVCSRMQPYAAVCSRMQPAAAAVNR
jgi:hypothetical protein